MFVKGYADNCRLYTPDDPRGAFANLRDNLDIYAFSHVAGWFVKVRRSGERLL